jgi:hypothetical protein
MKGFWRHVVSALVVVGGASLLACAHDDSTLFVYQVQVGTPSGSTCTFSPNPASIFLSGGLLDVGVRPEYDATYLVANQMVAQASPSTPQTETSFITIDHANVKITQTNGTIIRQYSTVTAATVPPATGATPGFIPVVDVPILDSEAVTTITGMGLNRVETFVQFFGKSTGGTAVESNTFEFPVDLCNGCLVVFPMGEDRPDVVVNGVTTTRFPHPNCFNFGAASTSTSTVSPPCRIGQDDFVDCGLCLTEVGAGCCASAACCLTPKDPAVCSF